MSKVTEAVALAKRMAADSSHGYDQAKRWGPDYDCSSFVITVWQDVGVPVKTNGAYNTRTMESAFLKCGFTDVKDKINLKTGYGLHAGDVLLNERNHTAMMVSETSLVQASINEKGTATGGQSGDQTGREIAERSYYNFPWNCVLRYTKTDDDTPPAPVPEVRTTNDIPTLCFGATGEVVRAAQTLLALRGFKCGWWGADGEFGNATANAVLKFQKAYGLAQDAIIGPQTWAALLGVT